MLHLQFGHASKERLQMLIDEAYGQKENRHNADGCKKVIAKWCDECETCRKMRRNPEKPVVGFLLGKIFNKVIGVDVRELEIPGDDRLSHTPF